MSTRASEGAQLQTYEQLHAFAAANGLEATKALLRGWIEAGEPEDFMPGMTTRAMCSAAGAGLDGIPVEQVPPSYMDTSHGQELYFEMWSGPSCGLIP